PYTATDPFLAVNSFVQEVAAASMILPSMIIVEEPCAAADRPKSAIFDEPISVMPGRPEFDETYTAEPRSFSALTSPSLCTLYSPPCGPHICVVSPPPRLTVRLANRLGNGRDVAAHPENDPTAS